MTTRHRNVSDLMTRSVVRVREDAAFKEIVKLLSRNDITAVPVVDGSDRPLGVVSEADLVRRESTQPDPSGLLALLDTPGEAPARPPGTTAGELMTSPAVCARAEWTVVQAAREMHGRQLKRLPVVDGAGHLVGIISRADLLQVFLRHDPDIYKEISDEILAGTLGVGSDEVTVRVTGGRVHLHGTVDRRSLISVIVRLCEAVDGVVDVTPELDYRTDEAVAVAGPERDRGLKP